MGRVSLGMTKAAGPLLLLDLAEQTLQSAVPRDQWGTGLGQDRLPPQGPQCKAVMDIILRC